MRGDTAIAQASPMWFLYYCLMFSRLLSSLLLAALFVSPVDAQDIVKIEGSANLVAPFNGAAAILKKQDIELQVSAESNSPRAIDAVGEGQTHIGISTRSLLPAERASYPARTMVETIIGYQALAFIVSQDVWDGGVRSLSKAQMQGIYEKKLTNWQQVGGADREIKFFNPAKGKGAWEFFVTWLYGEVQKAPLGLSFETVATAEETRNLIEFSGGSLSVIPPNRANSSGTRALSLKLENGQVLAPTPANVRSGAYPIRRPVVAVTGFRPAGPIRMVTEFICSAQGQGLVRRADIVPVLEEEAE